jgi:hypothetical protein
MTISKELLDELLKGCNQPWAARRLGGDEGLAKIQTRTVQKKAILPAGM